jgi:ferredoxin
MIQKFEADELKAFQLDTITIAKIREKNLPDKRKILFTTLKHAGVPDSFEILAEEDISFASQKFVDENCTNCQICYRICPTGALSSDGKFSLISFDAMLCVKCRLCHDVCEPEAMTLIPYNTKVIFEPKIEELINFKVVRCDECANYFTYFGGEKMCPRCKTEEEEAKSLWGIQ